MVHVVSPGAEGARAGAQGWKMLTRYSLAHLNTKLQFGGEQLDSLPLCSCPGLGIPAAPWLSPVDKRVASLHLQVGTGSGCYLCLWAK